jgi:hypothetical protein
MNRRSFLKILGIGTAAAAITPAMLEGFVQDPERLLWTPGERSFFLPPEKALTTYTDEEFNAMRRAIGVLRFYDRGTKPRAVTFNPWRPDQSIGLLSDQEIRLAIDTGRALAPGLRQAIRQHGKGHDLGALYRSGVEAHGRYTGQLSVPGGRYYQASVPAVEYSRSGLVYQHGQNLLNGPLDPHVCTQLTDRGIVVIGHRLRQGL